MAGKRFLFALTDEEAANPGLPVKCARSLVAAKKTGNEYEDDEAKLRCEAFVRLIDRAWRHPSIILQAESWFASRAHAM